MRKFSFTMLLFAFTVPVLAQEGRQRYEGTGQSEGRMWVDGRRVAGVRVEGEERPRPEEDEPRVRSRSDASRGDRGRPDEAEPRVRSRAATPDTDRRSRWYDDRGSRRDRARPKEAEPRVRSRSAEGEPEVDERRRAKQEVRDGSVNERRRARSRVDDGRRVEGRRRARQEVRDGSVEERRRARSRVDDGRRVEGRRHADVRVEGDDRPRPEGVSTGRQQRRVPDRGDTRRDWMPSGPVKVGTARGGRHGDYAIVRERDRQPRGPRKRRDIRE